ncbi:pectate lyase [Vibrio eleionomae]|nr:pectate lyase [Vibrio eleionomae]
MINLGISLSDSSSWQQNSATSGDNQGQSSASALGENNTSQSQGNSDGATMLLAMLVMAAMQMMQQGGSTNQGSNQGGSSDPFGSSSSSDNALQQLTNQLLQGSSTGTQGGGSQLSQAASPLNQEVGKMMDNQSSTFSSPTDLSSPSTTDSSALTSSLADTSAVTPQSGAGVTTQSSDTTQITPDSTAAQPLSNATSDTSSTSVNMFPTASSDATVVNKPIVVKAGETFDGQGKTFTAGSKLGSGDQAEDQKPLFELEDGATLKNVVIGDNGADGVHTHGDATVDNVHWTNVGEDALTMKDSGDVTIKNSSAKGADDKIFQLNAAGTLTLDNVQADDFGKLVRTNGGQQADWDINLNNVKATNGHSALVQSDSNTVNVNANNVTTDNVKGMYKLPDSASLNIS